MDIVHSKLHVLDVNAAPRISETSDGFCETFVKLILVATRGTQKMFCPPNRNSHISSDA